MNFTFFKKIFFVGPKPKELRTMLSLTPNAHKALSYIADNQGETIQKVISDALEQYLTAAVNEGHVPAPVETTDSVEEDQAV